MKRKKQLSMNLIKWMFRILLCIMFGYLLIGELSLPPDSPSNDYECQEFVSNWKQVFPDGEKEDVDIPGKCNGNRGDVIVIETVLPDNIEKDRFLCFRSSKQDMKFYVDGRLRMEYSTSDTRLFGKTTAVAYVFVEILGEDVGKTLRVETQTDSAYSGIFYSIYYGDRMGIWYNFFKEHGGELVIAFLALLLGLLSIVGSIFLKIVYRRQMDLQYLGWSVVVSSVWIIANSVFRQILFPNISTINDMTFCMVMLMPFPFLIYMNEVQKNRYVKVYFAVGLLAVIDAVACTSLHVLQIVDFADTIVYMAVACLFTVMTLIITMVIDIIKKNIWQYRLVAIGIFGACFAAVIQFANYFARAKEFDCSVLAMGLIFLLSISILNTGQNILHLESEKQQAILQSAAKARFLASMSHEIRTPINAILGMDEMILRESRDSRISEYALDIQNAGQGLLSIINEILDMSKIESGKMEIIPVDYDFSSVIHDVVNMVREKAVSKDLEIKVEVDSSLPARYFGDEVRIRQILLNLLNNAVKYTEKGSVSLEVSGSVENDAADLAFAVRDTGIGIKEDDISKLFEEYERIEEQRNRNVEGTGLGMNITLSLLHMMDSELKVESEYGVGSSFSFILHQPVTDSTPIGDLEERIKKQAEEYSYDVSFTAPEADILVVDDNSVNRKVFRSLLKLTKIKVDEAGSGKECLEKVSERHYDIIFLDHMMPEMDGVETLVRIQEMRVDSIFPCKDTPVVALTANAISGAKEMYLEIGFDAFLSKPIVPDKLEKMIVSLLPSELVQIGENNGMEDRSDSLGNMHEDDDGGLPYIEGINWEYALLHLPDVETVRDTVQTFLASIEHDGNQLKTLAKQINDEGSDMESALDAYRIKVHAMKSSAAAIGAVSLSGIAQLLEKLAKDGEAEKIISITPAFLDEWYSYRKRLECMSESAFVQDKMLKTADRDIMSAYLDVIEKAMDDMDIDILDSTMGVLMEYEYSGEIHEYMHKLKNAVSNLDDEETLELVNVIRDKMQHNEI